MVAGPDGIARAVPFLRRYARALTGRQDLGDQFVDAALDVLRNAPQCAPSDRDARLELFRVFHQVWTSPAPRSVTALPCGSRAWDFLGSATRRERQLLLLVAVEGWSLSEAAYILGLEQAEAGRLFQSATAGRHASGASVLIIEDEILIAMELEAVVEAAGHRVCGIAANEAEALALAVACKPRLILADIHLKGGQSGIAAARKILCRLDAPVIFITGYPQDLLTGMCVEPAFVITKPFNAESVVAAVSQALLAQVPAEPDAAWRLRGRPPETVSSLPATAQLTSLPTRARSDLSAPGAFRYDGGNSRARDDAVCDQAVSATPQGIHHARRADTSQR